MRYYVRILLLLLVLTSNAIAIVPPLTEEFVVQIALSNNPQLLIARAETAMATARLGMTQSEQKLQISANALATVSTMASSFQTAGVMPSAIISARDKSSIDLNLMLMYPLSTGGRLESNTASAQNLTEAAKAQQAVMRVKIAYEARLRFAQWKTDQAMLQVAQVALIAQEEQTRITEQLVIVGEVPRFDLMRQQAKLASMQQDVITAEADLLAAKARVAEILAVEVMNFDIPADETRPELPRNPVEYALAHRPDLQVLKFELAALKEHVQARQAAYKPQIYAVGMADILVPSDMGDNAGLSFGIMAGIPLGDGGRRRSEVDEAEQNVLHTEAQIKTIELQIRAEVAIAEAYLPAAEKNIQTAQSQLIAAQEGYRVAKIRYSAGKGIVVEVLDSLTVLTEAQQNVVQTQAEQITAYAEFYRALGLARVEEK